MPVKQLKPELKKWWIKKTTNLENYNTTQKAADAAFVFI